MQVVARAPNHLGDGVMALPAMHALGRATRLVIQAPLWGRDLYRDVPATVVPRGWIPGCDAAVLFPPSLRVALHALRARRRIGVDSDHRRWLLTDVVSPAGHRTQVYRRLAERLVPVPEGRPEWVVRGRDDAPDVPEGHIALNPISRSGPPVEWSGFRALARRIGRPVVFYAGPGEGEALRVVARDFPMQVGLPLPAFAAALQRASVFVSNDSGAAHFAAAVGLPTVVVHGSTASGITGPAGAVSVEGRSPCRPCYRKRCVSSLECLDIPVDAVLAAVESAVG